MDFLNIDKSYPNLHGWNPCAPVVAVISTCVRTAKPESHFYVTVGGDYDFNSWNRKLEQLRDLEDHWDGYTAPAPSEAAIVTAKSFLSNLLETNYEPSRLAPSVEGGIGITHKKRSRRVFVEFFNDGDVCALFSDGETPPRSRRVKSGYGKFKELSKEIRDYLDA